MSLAWRRRSVCAALVAAAASPLAAFPLAAAEPVAQVVRQQGGVLALAGTTPRALALGAPVLAGDRIVTGTGARVAIEFADGSLLAIGEESEVEIAAYPLGAAPGDGGLISLLSGILRSTLSAVVRPRGFEIATRAAVASARSTDWIVEAKAEGTAVFVVEGEVAVRARRGESSVLLAPGLGTDVVAGSPPTAPKKWGEARVASVLARTSVP